MIDWTRIEALRDEVGPEVFAEVSQMFVAEADAAVAGLSGLSDLAALEARMHALKGLAGNLGFERLAQLSAAAEAAAARGAQGEIDLDAIAACYAASRAAFLEG